jgi:uncharacterized DUF497 family protein
MQYTWDEAKRAENLRDHGIDFADAEKVFAGFTWTYEDDRFPYGERRFVTLGLLLDIPVSIAHTETSDSIHIISFRKATRHETELLFSQIKDQLPQAAPHAGRGHPNLPRPPRSRRKAHRKRNRPKRPKGRPS